jgi:cysteinyl-tRNA synthetase
MKYDFTDITFRNGAVCRLAMLMTHYQKPLDWTEVRMLEASKILDKLLKAAIPTQRLPPVEFIKALESNLNTPLAITIMHSLAKEDGEKLYACMKYLGIFDGCGYGVHELKSH